MAEGETMLAELNADSGNVPKSAALETRNVKERISNLRAGLKTWRDHLNRISALEAEFDQLDAEVRKEFADSAVSILEREESEEKEPTLTLEERLERCQVIMRNRSGKKSGFYG